LVPLDPLLQTAIVHQVFRLGTLLACHNCQTTTFCRLFERPCPAGSAPPAEGPLPVIRAAEATPADKTYALSK
jgi:hypothetical protein